MKITKRQLRRIIKEEKAKLQEVETLSPGSDEYDEAYDALFDELRNTFSVALGKGLISDDIHDAISDALGYIGEDRQDQRGGNL